MEKELISTPEFKKFIKTYRVGSPVQVNGCRTFITNLPTDNNGINGFKVFSNSSSYQLTDLSPIRINKEFFERHKALFKEEGSAYVYEDNRHIINVSEDGICIIDGYEFGYVYKHELKSILSDLCGINIPLFDDVSIVNNSGQSTHTISTD